MATLKDILVSLHGRMLGLGHRMNLINRQNDGSTYGNVAFKTITSAQLLAMNATPITVVDAAATGFAHIVKRVRLHKPAGTAYAGIAAGEDLVFKYTNGSGALACGQVETTGFLDQTTAENRVVGFLGATGTTSGDVEPVSAAAIVAHLLVGEITTGDSPLHVIVEYDTVKLSFTS